MLTICEVNDRLMDVQQYTYQS